MQELLDVAILGKSIEEGGEYVSAAARCIIQGINMSEPVSGKPNREWLEDEIADSRANLRLVEERFRLNEQRMAEREAAKVRHLRAWHRLLEHQQALMDEHVALHELTLATLRRIVVEGRGGLPPDLDLKMLLEEIETRLQRK